jgi:L-threonylcarbamoyladenylate synthase
MSPWALNRLTQAIAAGAVIGYPTDTIWGFGCDPLNLASVARLLHIKQRPVDKGLILLASDLLYLEPFIRIDPDQREILQSPLATPTTWLVDASEYCPVWIRGNHPTVAVRVTDHPLLRYLCPRLNSPLVSTSANRAGKSTVRSALQLRRQFADEVDFIVTGFNTGGAKPSEIKSLASGNLLRSAS